MDVILTVVTEANDTGSFRNAASAVMMHIITNRAPDRNAALVQALSFKGHSLIASGDLTAYQAMEVAQTVLATLNTEPDAYAFAREDADDPTIPISDGTMRS